MFRLLLLGFIISISGVNAQIDYDSLYRNAKENKEYKNALQYLRAGALLSDSAYNAEYKSKSEELKKKYETDKKSQEIKALQQEEKFNVLKVAESKKESDRMKLLLLTAVALFLAVMLFLFFLLRNYKLKKRVNEILLQRNEELVVQKNILENKNRQIFDSIEYAQNITEILFPDNNKLLKYGFELDAINTPSSLVNGMGYQVTTINNSNYLLCWNFDVTGIPGAIASIKLMHELQLQSMKVTTETVLESMLHYVNSIVRSFPVLHFTKIRLLIIEKNKFQTLCCGQHISLWDNNINLLHTFNGEFSIKDLKHSPVHVNLSGDNKTISAVNEFSGLLSEKNQCAIKITC